MATTNSARRTISMSESTNNTETNVFNTISNEHTVFAGTLRDWCDPLLQGQEPIPVTLCPRCVTCKCESLKDLPDSSTSSHRHYRHHQYHDPSCPNFRRYERTKSISKQCRYYKPKRRANSYDLSLPSNNHEPLTKQKSERYSSPTATHLIKRKRSESKIPVRISRTVSSSTVATTTSENSPSSSIHNTQSSKVITKIPRPTSNQTLPFTTNFTYANRKESNRDENSNDYDEDR